jgi:hypothetical protein
VRAIQLAWLFLFSSVLRLMSVATIGG